MLRPCLTLQEAAAVLGFTPKTVRNHLNELPHMKVFGRLRFYQDELENYLESKRLRAVARAPRQYPAIETDFDRVGKRRMSRRGSNASRPSIKPPNASPVAVAR